ncbi:PstS family phosphate ABC transporter substrate-binding protein [Elioraea tepidiphila]|uniref:PstS family phosphate ABC transporter substrate-binding protein n=1 Tax=Elioraea tepidiphila TaxID=457934 RepID=UPI00054F1046|nr:PstS family phosphate ABC transporter substrate-binding protein [Elioraea tepidiphila]
MSHRTVVAAIVASAVLGLAAAPTEVMAQARDQIRIVGSSTVFPFTTAVAEQFGRAGRFRTPVVESTGTGGGMRLFCAGIGPAHPDFTNASRRMTAAEFDTCQRNGVTEIIEMPVGFDGIVIAVRKGSPKFDLTREQIWKALARQVPVNGQLVNNPYQRWNEIDPSLPNAPIEIIGPPPTSGTRDSFVELVLDVGCRNVPEIRAIQDNRARQQACQAIREDGKFVEGGENDNLIVQRLAADRTGTLMGVFGFSYLDQNTDKIEGKTVDGVEPTYENIASGKYPVSRSMFVYAKRAHIDVIPGMREFIAEYMSDRAMNAETGYLAQRGLIVHPAANRARFREEVMNLRLMTRP